MELLVTWVEKGILLTKLSPVTHYSGCSKSCCFENFGCSQWQPEWLERLRSEDTPAASWLPILLSHIGSQVRRRQSQSYKFKEFAKISKFWNKHFKRHTFWCCLIRCANMKWIRRVLLKIQSGHDSVHRWTDGQTDGRTMWNQYTPLSTSLMRGV